MICVIQTCLLFLSATARIETQLSETFTKDLSLRKVYEKIGSDLPALDTLPWCVVESTGDLVYAFCDGVDYSIMFDADSFLADKQSKVKSTESPKNTTVTTTDADPDLDESQNSKDAFTVLNQITKEELNAHNLRNVKAQGESLSIMT